MHRDVSRKGCAEQSKTPVVHDIGLGCGWDTALVLGFIVGWKRETSRHKTEVQCGTAATEESRREMCFQVNFAERRPGGEAEEKRGVAGEGDVYK